MRHNFNIIYSEFENYENEIEFFSYISELMSISVMIEKQCVIIKV